MLHVASDSKHLVVAFLRLNFDFQDNKIFTKLQIKTYNKPTHATEPAHELPSLLAAWPAPCGPGTAAGPWSTRPARRRILEGETGPTGDQRL